jgi:hypothetical protein
MQQSIVRVVRSWTARFIDMMEQDRPDQHGGPGQGAKPRETLVGPEFLAEAGR